MFNRCQILSCLNLKLIIYFLSNLCYNDSNKKHKIGGSVMKTKKIRILGIAPYAGMKNTMTQLSEQREDLELVTYIGDLKTGVEIVSQHMSENFDAIISRGGTAELIRQMSTIPVIDISLSPYDILRAIKLAENYSSDYAIVGFSGITSVAHVLCDLLQYKINIVTLHNEEEVTNILETLKSKGCRMVLCDMITCTIAKQIGLNSILITSGTESIESAFDQAVELCNNYQFLRQKNLILTETLKNKEENTVVLTSNGTVIFSTFTSDKNAIFVEYLKKLIKTSQNISFNKSFHSIGNSLYAITLHSMVIDGLDLFVFSVEPNSIPPVSKKHGLQFLNYEDMKKEYYDSFYSLTAAASKITADIEQLNQTLLPVMILEEKGSGNKQVAARLYIESDACKKPFISINCNLIDEKNWIFLTQHYNSPFCDNSNTIFLSNLQHLSSSKRKQLLSLILDTNLHKRNRVILSCSQEHGNTNYEAAKEFIDALPCAVLYLPPLRQLKDDLVSSSSLYLNTLNITLSKQIIGFEQEALTLLLAYSWPQNFTQLKRVLTELVLLTTTPYIKTETVKRVLSKEDQLYIPSSNSGNTLFNINQSLNDIIREVIHITLKQCNGNQSQAAKKLGIGRTTLWRYLNQDN